MNRSIKYKFILHVYVNGNKKPIFIILFIYSSIDTNLTPSIRLRSSFNFSVLILFGTASKMMPIESFIMLHVVIITIIEKTKVHSGSAILAFGCIRQTNKKVKKRTGNCY